MGKLISLILLSSCLAALHPAGPSHGQSLTKESLTRQVSDHFDRYQRCGVDHFRELGKTEDREFDEVEITVAEACGQHISASRRAMERYGLVERGTQNGLINALYRDIVPYFRKAFNAGAKSTVGSDKLRDSWEQWKECLFAFAARAALQSHEPASVIVKATFAYCLTQENSVYAHMIGNGSRPAKAAREAVFSSVKELYESQILALVLEVRTSPSPAPDKKPTTKRSS